MISLAFINPVFLISLLAAATIGADQHFPSPDKKQSVTYRIYDDALTTDDSSNEATLFRGDAKVWSFIGRGRGFLFSWSPRSRFLLIGFVHPERDMALYCLDSAAARPKEHDLDLAAIEDRVEASLPHRHHKSLAGRSQIDFDRVEWSTDSRCRLHYHYSFDDKSGDAVLDLDLAKRSPSLKIVSIKSTPDE